MTVGGRRRSRLALRATPVATEAMTQAWRILSRRAISEEGMRRALEVRGVPSAEIRRVLGRLSELGYIDDRKLAVDWCERLRERGFGSLRIRDHLQKQGIDEKLAERVAPPTREERSTARKALRGRFGDARLTDRRTRAQAWRFLASRGFPDEVVESVVGVWEDRDDEG